MYSKGGNAIADKSEDIRVNARIRAGNVRLISYNGEQLGIVSISDALDAARKEGLDLVEVASNADPPVCRIMDYGKCSTSKNVRFERGVKKVSTTLLR